LHAAPEFFHLRHAMFNAIAGNEARVDGSDGRADDPIGFDAGLMQSLIDANLIGPERSAPLQHQHDLHWPLRHRRNSINEGGVSDIVRHFLHCTSPIAQYPVRASRTMSEPASASARAIPSPDAHWSSR
jgi:hypothetical protein